MPVRVNLVEIRAKEGREEGSGEVKKPGAKPNMVIREHVMSAKRKEKPKSYFMADLGNRK